MVIKIDLCLHDSLQVRFFWWQKTWGVLLFELVDLGVEQFSFTCLWLAECTTGLQLASTGNTCPVGNKLPLLWASGSAAKCKATKASQQEVSSDCASDLLFSFCSAYSYIWRDCCFAGQLARYSADKLWNQMTDNVLGMFGKAKSSKVLQNLSIRTDRLVIYIYIYKKKWLFL